MRQKSMLDVTLYLHVYEINIISNPMERRPVLRYSTLLINCHRQKNGVNAVCRSTINLAYRRLLPLILQEFRKYNKEQKLRVSGKRKGIAKRSNGWLCSTDFLRRKSKCRFFLNEVNKYNSLTHFNFSALLVFYKREEVEIRHEKSWYEKEQIHVQQIRQVTSSSSQWIKKINTDKV